MNKFYLVYDVDPDGYKLESHFISSTSDIHNTRKDIHYVEVSYEEMISKIKGASYVSITLSS